MREEVAPYDWLDWHSGRVAQDHAVRLVTSCTSVLPSDRNLRRLVEEQIIADLVGLAIHGRRSMERRGERSASISGDPLWPASAQEAPTGMNLWDVFGTIIHSVSLKVVWEAVDLSPPVYKGREAQFAGCVEVVSDNRKIAVPLGTIVSAYFVYMNRLTAGGMP